MSDDATKVSLAQLNDPRLYKVTRGVPIFKPHKRKAIDSKGKEYEIEVTEKDLPVIAKNMQDLLAQGVPITITDGHNDPTNQTPEAELTAPLVGYGMNPRTGTFGKDKTPCVMVDAYTKTETNTDLKSRPFRSAEYHPFAKLIRGLAVLIRKPVLDMGIVHLYGQSYNQSTKDYGPCVNYAMEYEMDEPKPGEKPAEEQYTPEEEAQYGKICKYAATHPKGLKMYGYGPMPAPAAAAGPGSPSGSNTMIPGEDEEKKKAEELALNAAKDNPVLYAALQGREQDRKRLAALEANNAALLREREEEKCKTILNGLRVDYKFDYDYELEGMLPKTKAEREKHVARIKEFCSPQDQQIQVYAEGNVEGGVVGDRPPSQDFVDMVVQYSIEQNLVGESGWDEALAAVKGGKRPRKMPNRRVS